MSQTTDSLTGNNTNLSSIPQPNSQPNPSGAGLTAGTLDATSYYSSEEYRRYYQQYQQQYAAGAAITLPPTLPTTTPTVPTLNNGLLAGYTPEQVTAYYQTLAATNPEAYAKIYAQYYGAPTATVPQLSIPQLSVPDSGTNAANLDDDYDDDPTVVKANGQNAQAGSALPVHCNDKMGLNPLIFTNINQSPYFKTTLHQMKTYQEVVDEIYYNVGHLEPWERGSRNASGVTGMCGSVRGVSAGGIISTPFCILYKLYLLRLTKKQVLAMIKHKDSVFIRGLGFLYLRFTQQPKDLFRWFEPYLGDEEEIDPRAGGGSMMTIGKMCRKMLTRNEWFSTMFPRIPVPVQKEIDAKLMKWDFENEKDGDGEDYEDEEEEEQQAKAPPRDKRKDDEYRRAREDKDDGYRRPRDDDEDRYHSSKREHHSSSREHHSKKERRRSRSRSRDRQHSRRDRDSKDAYRDSKDRDYRYERERDKYRSRDRY